MNKKLMQANDGLANDLLETKAVRITKKKEKKAAIFYPDEELYEQIKERAVELGLSYSSMIVLILKEYFRNEKK